MYKEAPHAHWIVLQLKTRVMHDSSGHYCTKEQLSSRSLKILALI